jgi:putative ABC transport system permease protein
MAHKRFILRQLTYSKKQTALFLLCVALSIVTLVALNGFGESVNQSMLKDAKRLHAADIIIRSHYEFSEAVSGLVDSLESRGAIESAGVHRFYSVARTQGEAGSLLSDIKVVSPGYPFYGAVELKSGRPFHEVLKTGAVVVEQSLLDRLQINVGDPLHIGDAAFTIRDVVLHEPDRPVSFFSLGPRVFIAAADLDSLGLVTKGSRVDHVTLIKAVGQSDVNRIADQLKTAAQGGQERVETYRTASSRVKRFFDNLLFYLNVVGIFTLLLAGIGIQSAVTAFLKEQEATIGIMKALGATGRFIVAHFIVVLFILGALGTLTGLAGGCLLQIFLPKLFEGLLPPTIALSISLSAAAKGLLLGFLVVTLFTSLPLYRLMYLKPNIIFRKESLGSGKGPAYGVVGGAILLCFTGMVLWQLEDLKVGIYFVLAVLLLLLVISALTEVTLFALKKRPLPSLPARQAGKGLFRPRNSTRLVITTLTTSLAVIFSITLIELNLDATFIRSYPDGAPNVFFLDIQPSQLADFAQTLDMPAEYYPVVRARISSINGKPIDANKESQRRGDNMSREFNLTYRDHLLSDETIVRGTDLYGNNSAEDVQVSVLDTFANDNGIKMGDEILFSIQGVPIHARVSSIRSHARQFIQPFFYFVFPEHVLKDAPQTIFTAVRVEKERIPKLQNEVVSRFPNVSVIDATQTAADLGRMMHKLSAVVRFFALFSFIAGILIIISSVLATRSARIQQAVYYKILGARGVFVLQVFAIENIILGLSSALPALAVAQAGSWMISKTVLDIPYRPFLGVGLVMTAAALLTIVTVGLLASIPILRQRPVVYLREQTEE